MLNWPVQLFAMVKCLPHRPRVTPTGLRRKSGTRGRPAAGELERRKREIITVARRIFGYRPLPNVRGVSVDFDTNGLAVRISRRGIIEGRQLPAYHQAQGAVPARAQTR